MSIEAAAFASQISQHMPMRIDIYRAGEDIRSDVPGRTMVDRAWKRMACAMLRVKCPRLSLSSFRRAYDRAKAL